jgi:hypothetical protein
LCRIPGTISAEDHGLRLREQVVLKESKSTIKARGKIAGIIAILAVGLLAPQIAQAQGTLYLSSLSGTSTGSASVASDSWLAARFKTGANSDGYSLNSIQLAMTDASGSPSGFTVMIYSEANNPLATLPGNNLGTLTGSSSPSTAGVYDYTAPSSLSLSPQTTYFIVLTSSSIVANGAYDWNESEFPPGVNMWSIGNGIQGSSDGTSGWSTIPYLGIPQLAINATPAPEPGVVGLFALGGLLVASQRRLFRRNI